MYVVKDFLETSTIHGLGYIVSTKKLSRFFWVCVVIAGFTIAGILIQESVESWTKNKISTTIEKFPISDVTFPKVTVCPPKNTFTNLNYDLVATKHTKLNTSTQSTLVNDFMKKVVKWKVLSDDKYFFKEDDKGRNRYQGMSKEVILDDAGNLWRSP